MIDELKELLMITAVVAQQIAPVVAVLALQAIGKAIPDDRRGLLGVVRKVAKVATLYIENKKK